MGGVVWVSGRRCRVRWLIARTGRSGGRIVVHAVGYPPAISVMKLSAGSRFVVPEDIEHEVVHRGQVRLEALVDTADTPTGSADRFRRPVPPTGSAELVAGVSGISDPVGGYPMCVTTSDTFQQSSDDQQRSLESLFEPGTTCMIGTTSGANDALEFRPLTVARVDGTHVYVLLDTRERWVGEFTDGDVVHVTLSDNRSNDWAHVAGTGTVLHDEALIDELWNHFAGAYFDDGRATPGIAVFRLSVEQGRYWSTPSGRFGSVISMVSAALGRGSSGADKGDIITS